MKEERGQEGWRGRKEEERGQEGGSHPVEHALEVLGEELVRLVEDEHLALRHVRHLVVRVPGGQVLGGSQVARWWEGVRWPGGGSGSGGQVVGVSQVARWWEGARWRESGGWSGGERTSLQHQVGQVGR